jgi:heme-degrading monooxygenase HmoA
MRAEVPGMTQEMYDGMVAQMVDEMRMMPGFIAHYSRAMDGGWEVVELWESQQEFDDWYQGHVAPAVQQAGINPQISVTEVHNMVAI